MKNKLMIAGACLILMVSILFCVVSCESTTGDTTNGEGTKVQEQADTAVPSPDNGTTSPEQLPVTLPTPSDGEKETEEGSAQSADVGGDKANTADDQQKNEVTENTEEKQNAQVSKDQNANEGEKAPVNVEIDEEESVTEKPAESSEDAGEQTAPSKKMTIANVKHSVHMRKAPNEDPDYYCDILLGEEVEFIEYTNDTYAKIRYNGYEGYVKRQHLSGDHPQFETAADKTEDASRTDSEQNNEKENDAPVKDTDKPSDVQTSNSKGKVIVLDPGHGKSSFLMSEQEKADSGWINRPGVGWGEWRHWKSGTLWHNCEGSGCNKRLPKGETCWYGIGRSNRDNEPAINLRNALSAKKYLEQMGYTVRITRTTNDENPSMTKRLSYCCPGNDTTKDADADLFVCLHSNATGNGSGRGSYYISLYGDYDQKGADSSYIADGNRAGKCINDRIIAETSLSASRNGVYNGYPELVLFCKSPVPIAYMEIGYFDNKDDLAILNSESDKIGRAIANGINDYFS